MRVGDLVRNMKPSGPDRIGLIIKKVDRRGSEFAGRLNEIFKVLWSDGEARPVWDYNLEIIGEDR